MNAKVRLAWRWRFQDLMESRRYWKLMRKIEAEAIIDDDGEPRLFDGEILEVIEDQARYALRKACGIPPPEMAGEFQHNEPAIPDYGFTGQSVDAAEWRR
jgi:hypothetical protein